MKRSCKIISGLFFFLYLSFPVKSQYNVVKLDHLGLISNLQVVRMSYERSLTNTISVGIGFESGKYASTTQGAVFGPQYEIYRVTGWGMVPEVRIYPFNVYKPAPVGFFIGSHFRIRRLKEVSVQSPGGETAKGIGYNLGINAGYKIRISQFIMDLVLGYGPSGGEWKEEKGRYSFKHFEDKVRIEFSLGFVFPKIPRKDKSGKYLYL